MKKQLQAIIIATVIIAIIGLTFIVTNNNTSNETPRNYTYEIINTYPHDQTAFTQGLEFNNGFLFESTGRVNFNSTLRRVKLETGKILQNISLPDQYFAEGITILNNKIIQLTWISNVGFVYEKDTFRKISEFTYTTQGWGITNDGTQLIMSDGTSILFFLDPQTYEIINQIEVFDQEPITYLNELEYINGKIFANIWREDKIAIINPQSGKVEAWIDLTGLDKEETPDPNRVLNGIAYDAQEDRLFVTGKWWSNLFEIDLKKIE